MTSLSHSEGKGRPTWHLNFTWSIAEMDKLQTLVERRYTAREIALRFACEPSEIREVCTRNGLELSPFKRASK